jgi:hypothetical protein
VRRRLVRQEGRSLTAHRERLVAHRERLVAHRERLVAHREWLVAHREWRVGRLGRQVAHPRVGSLALVRNPGNPYRG